MKEEISGVLVVILCSFNFRLKPPNKQSVQKQLGAKVALILFLTVYRLAITVYPYLILKCNFSCMEWKITGVFGNFIMWKDLGGT